MFTDRSRAVLLKRIICVTFSISALCLLIMFLRASVYYCLVVTYWERADLLALVCVV